MAKKGLEIDTPLLEITDDLREKLDKAKPNGGYQLPLGYLSHSQINMYQTCPRQYYWRYVRDQKRPPGIALSLGSSAHKALETTHNYLLDYQRVAPLEEVLTVFSDTFDKHAKEIPQTEWQNENTDKGVVKDTGVRLLSIYNTRVAPQVRPQLRNGIRGIEKKFETRIADVPVLGYIDLIDENTDSIVSASERELLENCGRTIPTSLETSVVDFKFKSKTMSQSEVDGSLQLTLYAWVENIPLVRFDQFLKQKTPRFKRLASRRTPKQYVWMHEVINGVARAISAGIFPPCDPTSWACSPRWCGFYHFCRGSHGAKITKRSIAKRT